MSEPQRIDDELWELPVGTVPGMRVPARVFADDELLAAIEQDRSLEQVANVATLPGIVDAAWRCPTSTGATASPSAAWRPPTPTRA